MKERRTVSPRAPEPRRRRAGSVGVQAPGPETASGVLLDLQRKVGNRTTASWLASGTRRAGTDDLGSRARRRVVQRFTEEDVNTAAYYVWKNKGGKPDQSPEEQAADYDQGRRQLELKERFSTALDENDPAAKVKEALKDASALDKRAIWFDQGLMAKAEQKVGDNEFMALVALLGVQYKGAVEHKPAAEADKLIRDRLGQEAATAIQANKTVEGQVAILDDATWAKVYATQFPGDTQDQQLETNAFVATKHPGRPIILHKDRGNPGTVIHEGIHKYSHDAVGNVSWNLDEGMTEYFTREVTAPLNIQRSNYQKQFEVVEKLVGLLGRPRVVDAYFNGNSAMLKTVFVFKFDADLRALGQQEWQRFIDQLNQDKFITAKSIIDFVASM